MDELNEELPPPSEIAAGQAAVETRRAVAIVPHAALTGDIAPVELSGALRELLEAGVRGQAGMLLLQTSAARLETELSTIRRERDEARNDASNLREKWFTAREDASVLRERLGGRKTIRLVQSVLLTLGGITAGIATPRLNETAGGWPIAATLLAALMLICGWLPIDHWRQERQR